MALIFGSRRTSSSEIYTSSAHTRQIYLRLTPEPGTTEPATTPPPTLSRPRPHRRTTPTTFPRTRQVAAAAVDAFLTEASLLHQLTPRVPLHLDNISYSLARYLRLYVDQLAQSTLGFAKVVRYTPITENRLLSLIKNFPDCITTEMQKYS